MTAVFVRDAIASVGASCRVVLGACLTGDALRREMSTLRDLASFDPADVVTLRRNVAEHLLDGEHYISQ